MSAGPADALPVLADLIQRFGLASLEPALRACETLAADDAPLDVAVLGQFKSGKSSLLNAVLGEAVFPIGVLPVTAVVTRAAAGPVRMIRVTGLDGAAKEIVPERLAEFVTEAGNPGNRRRVALVDVFTLAMADLHGVRLVDTPGLGSVFTHNTEATRAWMPNVAAALVTVSADRPLSDEDRRLVAEARQTAPRVFVILTKVDLLTDAERAEVTEFLERTLREHFGAAVPVLPFSSRVEPERWVRRLRDAVLSPLTADVAGERRAALDLKLAALIRSCREYLGIGLLAAERADVDRERLRAAVLDESVNASVMRDELRLAEAAIIAGTRPAFEKAFFAEQPNVEQRLSDALSTALRTWNGNLAEQTERYEAWMAEHLTAELTPLSRDAAPLAANLLRQAEVRFRRIIEAFRDRLGRNIHAAMGVVISPAAWEVKRPRLEIIPVAVSRAFMTDWTLLWWMLPMTLVGGLFRRHVLRRVAWEVEKNLARLTGDWAEAVAAAVRDLRQQAAARVEAELATLERLLGKRPAEAAVFREALGRLDKAVAPQTG